MTHSTHSNRIKQPPLTLLPNLAARQKSESNATYLEDRVSKMLIVHVHVHVRPESVEAFRSATLENASKSIQESGVARFDVMQVTDEPTRFVLVEVYRTPEDPARHKETPHYRTWRDTVENMMAEPRKSIKYTNIFPADTEWG